MRYKKSAFEGFSTITWWVFIIAIGIILLIMLGIISDTGQTVFANLRDALPFI